MVCYQVGIILFLLQICSAFFNFEDPQKYLICFFQQFEVFKCQDYNIIKNDVKIYYFSSETGKQIGMHKYDKKCPIPNMPIKIITHGWGSSTNNPWFFQMYEFYRKARIRNVFAVDWSKFAGNPNYLQSAADVKCVGNAIADFIINQLVRYCNSDLRNLHLIGHSLGAHISGYAGKHIQRNIHIKNGEKIHRITGLDPAGPYFWKCDPQYRLDKDDAEIVDVIHTDEFKFGCTEPIGHFDFYVNGGHAPQPGCFLTRKKREMLLGISCSHSRATALFIESINSDGFISKLCGNEILYKLGQCDDSTALIMGEYLNGTLDNSGIYQLQTHGQYPFAKFGEISLI